MKTLRNKKTGEVIRTDNEVADKTVGSLWEFCSKSEWKKIRGSSSNEKKEDQSKKEKTKSDKLERHLKLKEKQREL